MNFFTKKPIFALSGAFLIAFALGFFPRAARAHGGADFYHVRSTADAGPGTLREAISFANDDEDTQIAFQISRDDPNFDPKTGIFTIELQHALPRITGAGTNVDGLAQTLIFNSNPRGPEIRISGKNLGQNPALVVDAPNCQIKGVIFSDFKSHAVVVTGAQTLETRVMSNTFQNIGGAAVVFSGGASASWVGIAPKASKVNTDDDFHGLYGEDVGVEYGNQFQNCSEGVRVAGADSVGNSVRGNRFEAVKTSINLRFEGETPAQITPNDALDADNGPNDGLNAPQIQSVTRADQENQVWHRIAGIYNGAPSQKLTLDIYWDAQTPGDDGKSRTSQKTLEIQTDKNGFASWETQVRGYPAGKMRAAATAKNGSTSEMSAIFDVPWIF